ncbi:tetratricopeptide repeat protein [Hydrogenimonas sp. SS33]|uniref:tetratricopeptide repeat protein n=1 Tax=Hydrogenimonas leucolamina TaxID=2954236 RepID=UPI00336BE8B7
MGERLAGLERRCRRRRLKRLLKGVLAAGVAAAAVAAGTYYFLAGGHSAFEVAKKCSETAPKPLSAPTPKTMPRRPEPEKGTAISAVPEQKASSLSKSAPEKLEKAVTKSAEKRPKPPRSGKTRKTPKAQNAQPSPVTAARGKKSHPAEPGRKPSLVKPGSEKRTLPVLRVTEVTDLQALIGQYRKYPRYATALKIAEIYYDRKAYAEASRWAREANRLNRDDEKAWILYARSEYALGRKERARRILRLYLDYKESPRARSLLAGWSRK